jgi:hypothetical protein
MQTLNALRRCSMVTLALRAPAVFGDEHARLPAITACDRRWPLGRFGSLRSAARHRL